MKVAFEQLRLWYQTLDDLLAHKASIETAIWRQLRDLFSLAPELVFYDLTSTYFEGQGPAELGRFGYSRDSQPRKRQVLVGGVMMQGWLMLRSLVLRRLLAESPGLVPGLLVPAALEIVYSYTAASMTAGGASRARIP